MWDLIGIFVYVLKGRIRKENWQTE